MSLSTAAVQTFRTSIRVLALVTLAACGSSAERILFDHESDFQRVIVSERGDRRTLRFGDPSGAVQSRVRLGHPEELLVPYVRVAMDVVEALPAAPRRVLVIGLGGGSMPSYLHTTLPEVHIDVAEIDPVVVEVAHRFFGFVEDNRLRVLVGDARDLLPAVTEPYDLILVDAYGRDAIPLELTTRDFLHSVERATVPGGTVVANVWGGTSNQLYSSILANYSGVFDELEVIPVARRSNRIFVANRRTGARETE
jgi:spermidine synthase